MDGRPAQTFGLLGVEGRGLKAIGFGPLKARIAPRLRLGQFPTDVSGTPLIVAVDEDAGQKPAVPRVVGLSLKPLRPFPLVAGKVMEAVRPFGRVVPPFNGL